MIDWIFKFAAVVILLCFYLVYIGKMIAQKQKGIQTNQMVKGEKAKKVLIIEKLLTVATYSIVIVQLVSIIMNLSLFPLDARIDGILLGIMGDIFFAVAIYTMRDSWRAGIPDQEKTKMVTKGIYGYSRNPAFIGFYLMYLGILLMYFNIILLIFTCFAIIMLHLQVLQEEQYLSVVFGSEYMDYKAKVMRYLGRRNAKKV